MKVVNHKELREILKIAYLTKTPYFVWGAVGVGKSESIRTIAKEIAGEEKKKFVEWNKLTKQEKMNIIENNKDWFVFVDQRALQFDLGDFKLPHFNNSEYFEWRIPLVYALLCKEGTKGLLFFDEFNLAPPTIEGMFYQIINDRQIGENKISDGVFIVGAGNRAEDKTNIYEMGSALLDRFEHVELGVPSIEDWTEWAIENGVDNRIIAFLNFKPAYLYKFDENVEDKAFPTPRGNFKLSRMLRNIPSEKLDLIEKIVATHVGEAYAIEFTAFLKLQRKISVEEIIKNPEKIKEIEEIGLKYSLLGGISEYLRMHKDTKTFNKILKLCDYLSPEFAILLIRFVKGIDEKFFKANLINTKLGEKLANKYSKYIF